MTGGDIAEVGRETPEGRRIEKILRCYGLSSRYRYRNRIVKKTTFSFLRQSYILYFEYKDKTGVDPNDWW